MPGVPLPLSRVSRRVLTCLPSMVIPKVLDVVLPRGVVEGTWEPLGAEGATTAAARVPSHSLWRSAGPLKLDWESS